MSLSDFKMENRLGLPILPHPRRQMSSRIGGYSGKPSSLVLRQAQQSLSLGNTKKERYDMISTVTSKGQVTIPKEIRNFLKIKPSDKVNFEIENGRVILKPIKTLLNFRGSVSAKGKGDFHAERQQAKQAISKKVIEAME